MTDSTDQATDREAAARFSKFMQGTNVHIHLNSGELLKRRISSVAGDSIVLVTSQQLTAIPFRQVNKVVENHIGFGILRGLFLGEFVGGVIGLLAISPNSLHNSEQGFRAVGGMFFGAAIGAVIGIGY